MTTKMTPALEARLRSIAEARHYDDFEAHCLVVFRVCRICGHAEWYSSEPSSEFKVALNEGPAICTRCIEVRSRAPEIFAWVLGVFVHQQDQSSDAGTPAPESQA